ncbi:AAA family ATPase [Alteromonas sp. McT4-15]|uniref:DUF3696 domain-containing protein n=1 Tax=Alteromonas sp. McT4-15 TaxID=2881256 RepID=UPI001CF85C2F|nr:AAA family ATPase [Alteromonas sp. McT4-15]MCB4435553.1 AAA family ATPase [Alteromonas sp. McT4-15]
MAALKSLGLRNFKSIGNKQQVITLAPITLLFGPNSAGKSTVLQALIYLKEVVSKRNFNPDYSELGGEWLDLGGFKNIVHNHDLANAMEFEVTLAVENDELPSYLTDYEAEQLESEKYPAVADIFESLNDVTIFLSLKWSQLQQKVVVQEYSCKLNGAPVAQIKSSLDGKQIEITALPLAVDFLQTPIPSLGEEESLAYVLAQRLDTTVLGSDGAVLDHAINLDDKDVAEISVQFEKLKNSGSVSKEWLLEAKNALSLRTTRTAASLKTEIEKALELNSDTSAAKTIGLPQQKHALPEYEFGLRLDADAWEESEEELPDVNEKLLRTFACGVLNSAVCGPLSCLASWLENLNYIGPLRDLPPRNIQARTSVNKSRWAKGLAAWEMLPDASKKLIDEINFWLGEGCLNSGYQVSIKHYRELDESVSFQLFSMLNGEIDLDDQVRLTQMLESIPKKVRVGLTEELTGLEVMPQDIGVGISQLFPVIALSVFQKNGLAAIEQPELHIHPKLQVELADMFVSAIKNKNMMFLLETHSEHLMLRLLRRIREANEEQGTDYSEALTTEDLSVQYVQSNDGLTEFKHLRVSDDGDFIDEWPSGFFDERDEELFF